MMMSPSSLVHQTIKYSTEKLLLEVMIVMEVTMKMTFVVAWIMVMLMMLQGILCIPITLVTRMTTVNFIILIVLTYF